MSTPVRRPAPRLARALLLTLVLLTGLFTGLFVTGLGTAAHAATPRVHTVELTTPVAARATALEGLTVRSAPRATAISVTLPATTAFVPPRVLLAPSTRGTWLPVVLPPRSARLRRAIFSDGCSAIGLRNEPVKGRAEVRVFLRTVDLQVPARLVDLVFNGVGRHDLDVGVHYARS